MKDRGLASVFLVWHIYGLAASCACVPCFPSGCFNGLHKSFFLKYNSLSSLIRKERNKGDCLGAPFTMEKMSWRLCSFKHKAYRPALCSRALNIFLVVHPFSQNTGNNLFAFEQFELCIVYDLFAFRLAADTPSSDEVYLHRK